MLTILAADASSSYVPVQFSNLQAKLYDLDTNKIIATGDLGKQKVNHAVNQPVILPVTFSYSALNTSDPTWVHIYQACGHLWPGTVRPGKLAETRRHGSLKLIRDRSEIEVGAPVFYRRINK